ncbi:HOP2 protein, partial [Urocolius indicus]|nr:HOP2 protein [Urocolius indicus]
AQQSCVREKVYGNQKIYFTNQEQLLAASDAELCSLDGKIATLSTKVQVLQQSCWQMKGQLNDLNSSMTIPEMAREIKELKKDSASYTEKIKSATNRVTPQEKEKVKSLSKYESLLLPLSHQATELLEAILEGYPKSKKQFF